MESRILGISVSIEYDDLEDVLDVLTEAAIKLDVTFLKLAIVLFDTEISEEFPLEIVRIDVRINGGTASYVFM